MDLIYDELYCRIYLRGSSSFEHVRAVLSEIIGGALEGLSEVSASTMEIYVDENDEFGEGDLEDAARGFLYYPFVLDVDPREGTPRRVYISALGALLAQLGGRGFYAVAACDFEGELPGNGRVYPEL